MTNVSFKSVLVCGLLAFPTTVVAQDTQSNVPLPPPGPYLSISNSLASPVMAAPSAQNSGDQKGTTQPVKDGEFPPANFDPQADGSQQQNTSDAKPQGAKSKDEGVKKLLDANKVEQNKPVYAPQGTAKSLEEPKAVAPTASQNNTTAPQPNVNDYAPLPQFNAPTWGGNGNAATNDNSANVQPAPSNSPASNSTNNPPANQQANPPVVSNPQPNAPQFSNNNGWQNNNGQNQQFNNSQNNGQNNGWNNGWNNGGNNRQNNGWNNGQNNNSYNRQNQQWGNQQFQQRNQNFQNGYGGNWQQQNRNFPNWNNNNFQGNGNQYQNNQRQKPQLAPRSSIIVKNKLIDLS